MRACPACEAPIPAQHLLCRRCWRLVPAALRDAVARAFAAIGRSVAGAIRRGDRQQLRAYIDASGAAVKAALEARARQKEEPR